MHRFKIFTLEEANRVLPTVIDLTQETQQRIESLRNLLRNEPEDSSPEELKAEGKTILNEWARLILELGAQPKGVFTVDFRTPDPNVLWCWTPGEEEITHRHYAWESFEDRISIVGSHGKEWPGWN